MTGELVPTDDGEVSGHRGSVAEDSHARPLLDAEADGEALDVVVALERHVEELHVEREARDTADAKEVLSDRGAKALHATLRVEPAARHEAPDHEGVDVTAQGTQQRDLGVVCRLVEGPIAGDEVVFLRVQVVEEALDRRELVRDVAVGEHAKRAPRGQHAAPHRGPLAEVLRVAHVTAAEVPRDALGRPLIGRSVVRDDDLVRDTNALEIVEERRYVAGEQLGPAVRGQDDRECWVHRLLEARHWRRSAAARAYPGLMARACRRASHDSGSCPRARWTSARLYQARKL